MPLRSNQITASRLRDLSRKELLQLWERNRALKDDLIRRLVLEHNRFDVLAEEVLGFQVCPHHRRILRHQYQYPWSQVLVWRGAGKSTMGTVTWNIGQVCKNRDRTILMASKTGANSQGFLKEIKGHLESNEKLISLFGEFVGNGEWSDTAIEVAGRTKPSKEPTINTVGVEGAVASKHYDILNPDDLVDEENSRTGHQREKMRDWYYKVLLPTLNPPVADDPFVGTINALGTRYHYEDQYGYWLKKQPDGTGGDMEDSTLVIPIERPDGSPEWAERFPSDYIQKLKGMGIIRFNSQYKCDCDAMRGQIFQFDDCRVLDRDELASLNTKEMRVYHGVDLAISEDEEDDCFAQCVIGIDPKNIVTVLDYQEDHLRFAAQTKAIIDFRKKWKPIRTGVEANAYQKAQIHQLEDKGQHSVIPIYTLKDKVTRAWNLEAELFHSKRIRFKPDIDRSGCERLREILVLFPNFRWKDGFDALDIAVSTSKARKRKERDNEPGLL